MRAILDTHALLWFLLDDLRLSDAAKRLIEEPANEILVSPASYWEIAIKIGLGKYSLHQPYRKFFESHIASNNFLILPILPKHTDRLTTMPFHHRDPFDRLIVSQAIAENVLLVSKDAPLDAYGIQRFW